MDYDLPKAFNCRCVTIPKKTKIQQLLRKRIERAMNPLVYDPKKVTKANKRLVLDKNNILYRMMLVCEAEAWRKQCVGKPRCQIGKPVVIEAANGFKSLAVLVEAYFDPSYDPPFIVAMFENPSDHLDGRGVQEKCETWHLARKAYIATWRAQLIRVRKEKIAIEERAVRELRMTELRLSKKR